MSRDYWEQRYQSKDMPWEKGAPSPGLVDFLAQNSGLARGKVCVPGCGTGHDVREFAKHDFAVTGFDIAPSAIELARQGAAAAGLNADFQLVDFLHADPPQKFDYIFEHTLFCAIQPNERDEYVAAVLRWLKPDGVYLAVNYIDCDPDGPPFPTTRVELLERFSPHFELLADWVPRSYANREGRERMFRWKRASR